MNQALSAASLPSNELTTTFSPLLIQCKNGSLILIDTGFGPETGRAEGATYGKLTGNLNQLGIALDSIGLVIISHFHPDHVGGLVGKSGPVFANVEIAVPKVEWGLLDGRRNATRAKGGE
jgi:glyoxylase-like metal-dependent hydrolase (beta-lactamase superfamily II)